MTTGFGKGPEGRWLMRLPLWWRTSLVQGSPEPEHGLGSLASVTWGTATLSRIGQTVAWSVEMAQHAEQVTGNPVSVWVSA